MTPSASERTPTTDRVPDALRSRLRRLSDWALLPGVVLGIVVYVFSVVSSGFFYVDDFMFFRIALDRGISSEIFTTGIYQHFGPGRMATDFFMVKYVPLNYDVALAIELFFFGAVLVTLYWICTELFGKTRWNILLVAMFGTSLSLLAAVQWWSQAIHLLPCLLATSVSILCLLRYVKSRRVPTLVLAVMAYCFGLLFFEKALFTPIYFALILVLFLNDRVSVRTIGQILWRERWIWVVFAIPTVLYLVNYVGNDFAGETDSAGVVQLSHYFRVVWLRGFSPMVIGRIIPPETTFWDEVTVVVAQVIIFGAVVVSLIRKKSAWRAWAFLAIVFFLNVLLIGMSRVQMFGVGIGYDLRYLPEVAFMFVLTMGFAFSPARSSEPSQNVERVRSSQATGRSKVESDRNWTPVLTTLTIVAFVAYAVSTYSSAQQLKERNLTYQVKDYFSNLKAGLDSLERRGERPVLMDTKVPALAVPDWQAPYNRAQILFAILDRDIRFGGTERHSIVVGPDGHLFKAHFEPHAGGTADNLLRIGSISPVGNGTVDGSTLCFDSEKQVTMLTLTPKLSSDAQLFLRAVVMNLQETVDLPLFVDRGPGYPAVPDRLISLTPSEPETIVPLDADKLQQIRIDVPIGERVCFGRLEIGQLDPSIHPIR